MSAVLGRDSNSRVPARDVHPAEVVRRMLPSLGYFGGVDANFAEAPIRRPILRLRFVVTSPSPSYLNLRGFVLRRDEAVLDAGNLVKYARLSSVRPPDQEKDPAGAFRLGGIHSDKEVRPSWEAVFEQPTAVDSVRIYNRLDALGRRSFEHEVWVTDADGNDVRIHRSGASETFLQTTRLLKSLLGDQFRWGIETTAEAQEEWRQQMVRALVRVARASKLPALTRSSSNLIFGLLPTHTDATLIDDDWFLLAYLLLQQRTRVPGTRTGIRSFASVLNSGDRVALLEAQFGEVEGLLGIEHHWIAEDGIRSDGPSDG